VDFQKKENKLSKNHVSLVITEEIGVFTLPDESKVEVHSKTEAVMILGMLSLEHLISSAEKFGLVRRIRYSTLPHHSTSIELLRSLPEQVTDRISRLLRESLED
jgi:hypothetical protein